MDLRETMDRRAIEAALRVHDREHSIRNSFLSGTLTEVVFQTVADYAAIASFTSETSLLSGARQPSFPAGFFDNQNRPGRAVRVVARGLFSTTGTPSYTFTARLGSTSGPATLTGTPVAVSAAIVTAGGGSVSNKMWEMCFDLICTAPGIGSGNCTLAGTGLVSSPNFASPFIYALSPGGGDATPWTSTIDDAVTNFLNLSVTSTASSASNTLTLKQLLVYGLN